MTLFNPEPPTQYLGIEPRDLAREPAAFRNGLVPARPRRGQHERARTLAEALDPLVDPRPRTERLREDQRRRSEHRELDTEILVGLPDRVGQAERLPVLLDRGWQAADGDHDARDTAEIADRRLALRKGPLLARGEVLNQEGEECAARALADIGRFPFEADTVRPSPPGSNGRRKPGSQRFQPLPLRGEILALHRPGADRRV